jgi:hypothetical protein
VVSEKFLRFKKEISIICNILIFNILNYKKYNFFFSFILKKIKIKNDDSKSYMKNKEIENIKLLCTKNHINFVNYHEFYFHSNNIFTLIMDYCKVSEITKCLTF